ncbi:MAG: type II secretion system protein F [Candidatus Mesenet longicola]|uniref:Type II secretion system protein F n=1 Tax=Candidatus Mesenet longicola TaxID=1892558 RepID=A0A8J3HVD8_9RICK|nr:MAG: type II secretion system protein F [Candidatus Mesenet longicola]GHM59835.1 MAG: type II secretion system protein F [Candidatus Mesenet longicola]
MQGPLLMPMHGLFNLRSFDIKQEDKLPTKVSITKILKIFLSISNSYVLNNTIIVTLYLIFVNMPIYYYKALNHAYHKVRGKLYATDGKELETKLSEIGLYLIDYHMQKNRSFLPKKISTKNLIRVCTHIEQMERAGLQLINSLEELCCSINNSAVKTIFSEVCEDIRSGSMLSSALLKYPKVFDKLFIALVAVGEKSGKLAEVFSYIADHLKWNLKLRNKIKRAIAYPLFMLVVICIVICVMTFTVVPAIETFLTEQEIALSIYTKLLISIVNFCATNKSIILIATTLFPLLIHIVKKKLKNFYSKVVISLPIIGKLIRKIEISRFCRFFMLCYGSGLDILNSIDNAKDAVKNLVIKEALINAKASISNGMTLTSAMQITNQFPGFAVHMFNIGEKSGNIAEAISNINTFYDTEINDTIDSLISIIKPAFVIILGLLIMWIIMAVFTPLYSSFDQLDLY